MPKTCAEEIKNKKISVLINNITLEDAAKIAEYVRSLKNA